MTGTSGVILKLYGALLRLYPASFRNEFKEQMLLDFTDMVVDAQKKGRFSFALFCLHELIDFSTNLLWIHLKEDRMAKILESPIINSGLRGSLGFAITFAGMTVATWGFRDWLFSTFEPLSQRLPIWYYEIFHPYDGTLLFIEILLIISNAFSGLIFGLSFALLLGDRSNRSRYLLAGMLGWFIPNVIFMTLYKSFNWGLYLGDKQPTYLWMMIPILQGAFLGAIFRLATSERKKYFQFFYVGVFIYPVITYLYVKLLFFFDVVKTPWLNEVDTPWFLIALMILLLIFLGSVFVVVWLMDRKMPWLVVAGAIGYPVLSEIGVYIARWIGLPLPEPGTGVSEVSPLILQISITAQQAIFGILLGLLLGLVFGIQNKNKRPSITAEA